MWGRHWMWWFLWAALVSALLVPMMDWPFTFNPPHH